MGGAGCGYFGDSFCVFQGVDELRRRTYAVGIRKPQTAVGKPQTVKERGKGGGRAETGDSGCVEHEPLDLERDTPFCAGASL